MLPPDPGKVLLAQGGYYVVSGVAPFISRRLFERITGPKLEWWLVETTGVLVTAVGAGLLRATMRHRVTPEIVGIAAACAAGLAALDVGSVARGRIRPVYLADAVAQLAAFAGSPALRGQSASAT